jgi:hypothetical protein
VIDKNIWNETVLYSYEETIEPGIIVEYDQQESMKDFIDPSQQWSFEIDFVSGIADIESIRTNYYITESSILKIEGSSDSSFVVDLNRYGIFSKMLGDVVVVYEVARDYVKLINYVDLPGTWRLDILADKPQFTFYTLKSLFNKYHFAFNNRDYFQNNSHPEMYIPDYNVCGDDSPIRDYGILNSEYAIILKQREAFLLTIDDNGYEIYTKFKSDIGTDYTSSLTSLYDNVFFFANKTGIYNLTTISNISVFDQVTVNVSEQILKLFNSITNKNKLITVSDDF